MQMSAVPSLHTSVMYGKTTNPSNEQQTSLTLIYMYTALIADTGARC